MIPLKSRRRNAEILEREIERSITQCTLYFSAGLRLIVLSFPVMAWVVGNVALIASTVLVLVLAAKVDDRSHVRPRRNNDLLFEDDSVLLRESSDSLACR